ncbi:hypothetical protein P4S72_23570 [Vibrio sp. PP-XX7]
MSGQQRHLVRQWRSLEHQLHFLLKFNGNLAVLERSLLVLAQSLAALVSAPPEIQCFARRLTILHLSIRRHQWPLSCYEEWHQLQLLLHVVKQPTTSLHENTLFWRSQLFGNPWYQKAFPQRQDLFPQKDLFQPQDFSQQPSSKQKVLEPQVSKPDEMKPDLRKEHDLASEAETLGVTAPVFLSKCGGLSSK